MKKFTYRNKETGRTVQSDSPKVPKGFVLVTQVRDGQMKGANIRTK